MEFLLASHRKHRRWVWLKQLLLLLLRMSLIADGRGDAGRPDHTASVVSTVRGPDDPPFRDPRRQPVDVRPSRGGSDRLRSGATGSSLQIAIQPRVGTSEPQKMTLIRLSRAARGHDRDAAAAATLADLNAMPIGTGFPEQLEERAAAFARHRTGGGPRPRTRIGRTTDRSGNGRAARVALWSPIFARVTGSVPPRCERFWLGSSRNGTRLRFVRCVAEKHAQSGDHPVATGRRHTGGRRPAVCEHPGQELLLDSGRTGARQGAVDFPSRFAGRQRSRRRNRPICPIS